MIKPIPRELLSREPIEVKPEAAERGKIFEELAFPILDELYRFACRLEKDPARAADLLQEALLTGFRKFGQLADGSSFRSWMAMIVRRTFLNRGRRSEPTVPLHELADADPDRDWMRSLDAGPDERLLTRRLSRELRLALDELPEEQRLAVFLVDVQGFSYREASGVLAAPAGTVASRVARGRAALRRRLWHLALERGWIS